MSWDSPTPGQVLVCRRSLSLSRFCHLRLQDITLFGGSSLPWACRFEEYGSKVSLLGSKTKVPINAYPNTDANNAVRARVVAARVGKGRRVCAALPQAHFFSLPPHLFSQRIEKILNDIHILTKFPVEGHFLVTTLWPTNCIIHTGKGRSARPAARFDTVAPALDHRGCSPGLHSPLCQASATASGTTGMASP